MVAGSQGRAAGPPLQIVRVVVAMAWAMPSLALACPNCANSGPDHRGLVWAAAFLLPLPFVAMGLVFWRLRREENDERKS